MDTRTSLFMVAMFALLIAWTWATADTGLCAIGIAVDALKKDGGTTCFEFWLNRYQSLISGVLSLGAAALAAYLVFKQLQGMRQANDISRRGQAVTQLDAVQKRHRAIRDAKKITIDILRLSDRLLESIEGVQEKDVLMTSRICNDLESICGDLLYKLGELRKDGTRGPDYAERIHKAELSCATLPYGLGNYETQRRIYGEEAATKHLITILSNIGNRLHNDYVVFYEYEEMELKRLNDIMRRLDAIILNPNG